MVKEEKSTNEMLDDRKGKIFCLVMLFMLIYGRMIYTTVQPDSGFAQKTSVNITESYILGDITGRSFNQTILDDSHAVLKSVFTSEQVRQFNSAAIQEDLKKVRKTPKAH